MSAEECVAEYKRLKVRVMRKQEQVPAGAKKANKHYRPWEEIKTHPQPHSRAELADPLPFPVSEGSGQTPKFKGIPYSEIISEWWQRNGGEPQEARET